MLRRGPPPPLSWLLPPPRRARRPLRPLSRLSRSESLLLYVKPEPFPAGDGPPPARRRGRGPGSAASGGQGHSNCRRSAAATLRGECRLRRKPRRPARRGRASSRGPGRPAAIPPPRRRAIRDSAPATGRCRDLQQAPASRAANARRRTCAVRAPAGGARDSPAWRRPAPRGRARARRGVCAARWRWRRRGCASGCRRRGAAGCRARRGASRRSRRGTPGIGPEAAGRSA